MGLMVWSKQWLSSVELGVGELTWCALFPVLVVVFFLIQILSNLVVVFFLILETAQARITQYDRNGDMRCQNAVVAEIVKPKADFGTY